MSITITDSTFVSTGRVNEYKCAEAVSLETSEAYMASVTAQNEADAALTQARAFSERMWGFLPLNILSAVTIICICATICSYFRSTRPCVWPEPEETEETK